MRKRSRIFCDIECLRCVVWDALHIAQVQPIPFATSSGYGTFFKLFSATCLPVCVCVVNFCACCQSAAAALFKEEMSPNEKIVRSILIDYGRRRFLYTESQVTSI